MALRIYIIILHQYCFCDFELFEQPNSCEHGRHIGELRLDVCTLALLVYNYVCKCTPLILLSLFHCHTHYNYFYNASKCHIHKILEFSIFALPTSHLHLLPVCLSDNNNLQYISVT